ncbi:MAG: Isoleucine--tRNA ligase [Alphaproteobacteria bacterium MarineAlpha11_Bin1]|nr:MAG: Isoleucine--tRNA ligase [Alphaproteobacteria bacterium MarineAlpha11_Bin1]|tara:strand:+ start:9455 stop:12331 length:2877 start_codon:yes stop_codon:yes gene_type:complete
MTDYKSTVFLPETDFEMRGKLPQREPDILAHWERIDLYQRQRELSEGREKFILHDGPPYANGNLHIGHALNKILKDVINRSQQMIGKDANYVPGWDCHGLPIEWKIEEKYRADGRDKDEVPIVEFRQECREFADHWIQVQAEEFKRLGVIGDWTNPYTTMNFCAEAHIARELMKFVDNGLLYQGSKPVMWSVVEKTALAEAEVEYHDHESDTIWCKFGIRAHDTTNLSGASVVIWTTTPWTIPGNRAICYSSKISYGLYEVTEVPDENWAAAGDRFVLADSLADDVKESARIEGWTRLSDVSTDLLSGISCTHPLKESGYDFIVPLLDGDHVTDDTGTGFVHTAPGHGREDYEIWVANKKILKDKGVDTRIPYTVDADGYFTEEALGFADKQVITNKGKKGNANQAVIDALVASNGLIARGRLKHQYPHSWRSKKPLIFRNTPQWFIAIDKPFGEDKKTLREVALKAIDDTTFYPVSGQNRLGAMIEGRPDWVVSRQRAWGVPITVFIDKKSGEPLADEGVQNRIAAAISEEGADAWFTSNPSRFLGDDYDKDGFEQVFDILDVWFDSGSTHSFVLEEREDLQWPASLYLEGSDQHRGWFHSSLLESCGTRGQAPYDAVLTHGFVLAEDKQKMSKSTGNIVSPQEIIKQYGADILRIWVVASDYSEDLKIGPEIIKYQADAYRRLRNTLRYILGNLNGFEESERIDFSDMPELERWVLHRLTEMDVLIRRCINEYDFHSMFTALHNFCAVDLSSFYFDVRKDTLYCDAPGSARRRAARTVLDQLFSCLTAWLAPVICFTAEEVWRTRYRGDDESVHLRVFPEIPLEWQDPVLAAKWEKVREVRRVVTGALEIERAEKRIGSSLQAAPVISVSESYFNSLDGVNLAEICITSDATLTVGGGDGFSLEDVPGVTVAPAFAEGSRCERCWQVLPEIGGRSDYPDICDRCADAVKSLPIIAE